MLRHIHKLVSTTHHRLWISDTHWILELIQILVRCRCDVKVGIVGGRVADFDNHVGLVAAHWLHSCALLQRVGALSGVIPWLSRRDRHVLDGHDLVVLLLHLGALHGARIRMRALSI